MLELAVVSTQSEQVWTVKQEGNPVTILILRDLPWGT